jgi:hypothetical protein
MVFPDAQSPVLDIFKGDIFDDSAYCPESVQVRVEIDGEWSEWSDPYLLSPRSVSDLAIKKAAAMEARGMSDWSEIRSIMGKPVEPPENPTRSNPLRAVSDILMSIVHDNHKVGRLRNNIELLKALDHVNTAMVEDVA